MKVPVKIRIEDGEGAAKIRAEGMYLEKNGTHCIFYSTADDGACSIRMSAAEAVIRREKGILPEMHIVVNGERNFFVDTPAGRLELSTLGKKIGMLLTGERRTFTLEYVLLESGEPVQTQNVVITVAGRFVSC